MKNEEKLSDIILIKKYEKGKIDFKQAIKPYLKKVKEVS